LPIDRIPEPRALCLAGPPGAGRSSLARRFLHGRFDPDWIETSGPGIRVGRRRLYLSSGQDLVPVDLQLWDPIDLESERRFGASLLQSTGALLWVVDATRPDAPRQAAEALGRLRSRWAGRPIALAAARCDQPAAAAVAAPGGALERVARALDLPLYSTSARDGTGVDEAFRGLAQEMLP